MVSLNYLREAGFLALLTALHNHFFLDFWREVVLVVACVPLVYYLIATLAALRFFSKKRAKLGPFAPPVSVLKPVRGVDFASYENFRSFCVQDYPEYEILFCVNDLEDEAVPLIHKLTAEFPERSIRLLSNAPQLGSNRKVNNLALLAREAKYELLVQSDGDVRVGPNSGGRVSVSREVVATMYPAVTFGKFWEHQTRWTRTVRLCRPASYVGLLFTHGLPWALAGALVSPSIFGAATFLGLYLVLRLTLAWTVGAWGIRDETTQRKLWLVPLRDAIHFAIWLASFFSDRITWGESEFQLTERGEMVAIDPTNAKKGVEKQLRAG